MSVQRIQMSRRHPWRAEHPDAVIVARPSRWGNPWRVESDGMGSWEVISSTGRCVVARYASRQEAVIDAVARYRNAIERGWGMVPWPAEIRDALHGKDVACWCALDAVCHGDVLLAFAGGEMP